MLDFLYQSASPEQVDELKRFIKTLQSDEILAKDNDDLDKLIHIRTVYPGNHPILDALKDEQLQVILHAQTPVVETIAAHVLAKQDKILHPNVKKALHAGLCLSAMYYAPNLMLLHTALEGGKTLAQTAVINAIGSMIGTKAVGKHGAKMVTLLNLAVPQHREQFYALMPDYVKADLRTLIPCMILTQLLVNYAAQPLKQLGNFSIDTKVCETALDFAELMWNPDIEADKLEKYKGSLATMTPDEIVESVGNLLSWAWQKMPSFRGTTTSQAPKEEAGKQTKLGY